MNSVNTWAPINQGILISQDKRPLTVLGGAISNETVTEAQPPTESQPKSASPESQHDKL